MICEHTLMGKQILLRMAEESDCGEDYIRWMNDYETNRFMETRWNVQDYRTITAFVKGIRDSSDSFLFAIVDKCSMRHIGNIKLGPINKRYKYADISYFIGETEFRRRGFAKEAVELICRYGFRELQLHRIQAGVISGNEISVSVLLSCGFKLEGRLSEKFIVEGKYADHLVFGLLDSGEA